MYIEIEVETPRNLSARQRDAGCRSSRTGNSAFREAGGDSNSPKSTDFFDRVLVKTTRLWEGLKS